MVDTAADHHSGRRTIPTEPGTRIFSVFYSQCTRYLFRVFHSGCSSHRDTSIAKVMSQSYKVMEPIRASASSSAFIPIVDDVVIHEPIHRAPSLGSTGAHFDIQWERLYYNHQRIHGLGYRIRDKRSVQKNQPPSWIWEHGADLEQRTTDREIQRFFLCRRCHQRSPQSGLFIINGNDHIRRHLEKRHRQFKDGEHVLPARLANPFVAATVAGDSTSFVDPICTRIDEADYQKKLVDWAICQDLTFRQVTHKDTRNLLAYQRPQLLSALPSSHGTLVEYIKQSHQQRRDQLQDLLLSAQSRIHISFDIWMSTNGLSLLGVVSHFLNANMQHRTALLGLPRLRGSHSGENIASRLARIIQNYKISQKLGLFQMDNASNNNTCMERLMALVPGIHEQARLRCLGHIFNLVVKAIVFGEGINDFERQLLGCSSRDHYKLWSSLSAIGKIHNNVRWILRSDRRRQDFADCQAEALEDDEIYSHYELILDGGVRWNAVYNMLRRAKKLRKAFEHFFRLHVEAPKDPQKYDHTLDKLDDSDWMEIDRFLTLLKPFKTISTQMQGNADLVNHEGSYGALWEVFTSMNHLSEILTCEEAAVHNEESRYADGIRMGLQKLNSYWDQMRMNEHYAAAVMLHPEYKDQWFTDKWRRFPQWKLGALANIELLFDKYVEEAAGDTDDGDESGPIRRKVPEQHQSHPDSSDDEAALDWRASQAVDRAYTAPRGRKKMKLTTELQRYYDDGLEPHNTVPDPRVWWQDPRRQRDYPTLCRMAIDLFSAPAMSSECERVFSQAKKLVTDERNRLAADTIEACECQKNWLQHGLVDCKL